MWPIKPSRKHRSRDQVAASTTTSPTNTRRKDDTAEGERRQGKKDSIKSSNNDDRERICPNILSLKPTKKKYGIAIFACGLFWNPQRRFEKMEGVKRCIVGYTGGSLPRPSPSSSKSSSSSSKSRSSRKYKMPTFENPQDHTQAIFIEYNPKKVSYQDLLAMWQDNDYPWEPEPLHLRSAVFTTSEEQREQAVTFLTNLQHTRPNCHLYVDIENANSTLFHVAEDCHQHYIRKQIQASKEQFLKWANDSASSGLCSIPE